MRTAMLRNPKTLPQCDSGLMREDLRVVLEVLAGQYVGDGCARREGDHLFLLLIWWRTLGGGASVVCAAFSTTLAGSQC